MYSGVIQIAVNKTNNIFQAIAFTRQKIIGEFEIKLIKINYGNRYNGSNMSRTIPSMSISVNDNYQGRGISTEMIRTLVRSLNKNEAKKINIMFINTDGSDMGSNGISFWQRIGMRPNRSYGYEKSILLNELKKRLRLN